MTDSDGLAVREWYLTGSFSPSVFSKSPRLPRRHATCQPELLLPPGPLPTNLYSDCSVPESFLSTPPTFDSPQQLATLTPDL